MTPLPPTPLQALLTAASDRADAHPEQVFDRLFGIATSRHIHHNGLYGISCDCVYCRALHVYTAAKVNLHRFRRRFDGHVDGYIPPSSAPYQSEISLQDDINSRAANVAFLRQLKNEVKSEIVTYEPQSHLTPTSLSVESPSSRLVDHPLVSPTPPIHSPLNYLDP